MFIGFTYAVCGYHCIPPVSVVLLVVPAILLQTRIYVNQKPAGEAGQGRGD